MLTCSIVQLRANTILNYLKPFLPGLLKSSVKYILVYKSLIQSSYCSICKLLAFGKEKPGQHSSEQTMSWKSKVCWGRYQSPFLWASELTSPFLLVTNTEKTCGSLSPVIGLLGPGMVWDGCLYFLVVWITILVTVLIAVTKVLTGGMQGRRRLFWLRISETAVHHSSAIRERLRVCEAMRKMESQKVASTG